MYAMGPAIAKPELDPLERERKEVTTTGRHVRVNVAGWMDAHVWRRMHIWGDGHGCVCACVVTVLARLADMLHDDATCVCRDADEL